MTTTPQPDPVRLMEQAKILLQAMGPCSVESLAFELRNQVIGVNKENAREHAEWTIAQLLERKWIGFWDGSTNAYEWIA